jgi:hypothetical protein
MHNPRLLFPFAPPENFFSIFERKFGSWCFFFLGIRTFFASAPLLDVICVSGAILATALCWPSVRPKTFFHFMYYGLGAFFFQNAFLTPCLFWKLFWILGFLILSTGWRLPPVIGIGLGLSSLTLFAWDQGYALLGGFCLFLYATCSCLYHLLSTKKEEAFLCLHLWMLLCLGALHRQAVPFLWPQYACLMVQVIQWASVGLGSILLALTFRHYRTPSIELKTYDLMMLGSLFILANPLNKVSCLYFLGAWFLQWISRILLKRTKNIPKQHPLLSSMLIPLWLFSSVPPGLLSILNASFFFFLFQDHQWGQVFILFFLWQFLIWKQIKFFIKRFARSGPAMDAPYSALP